jgi:hypothetical protein
MGITVEEYLKDREACSVCGGTEHEEHCVTTMLSRADNCLIYNAINYNGMPKNFADIQLLQGLRATAGQEQKVLDYYLRSAPLVQKIKRLHNEDTVIWNIYYTKYVEEILNSLRQGLGQQAHELINAMLAKLESEKL